MVGRRSRKKFSLDFPGGGVYRQPMKKGAFGLAVMLWVILACGKESSPRLTITWWQFWTDTRIKPVVQEIVRDFEKAHPGVAVELVDLTWTDGHDKIAMAFSSHAAPDVVELGSDWIPEFSSTGHLYDITTQVDSVTGDYLMWDPAVSGGRIFAFPWILGTRVLFGNTALLEKAGLSSEFIPSTWPELLDAAQKVSLLGGDVSGFGSNSAERHRLYKKYLPFLWANGGTILSPDGRRCLLASPAPVAALEFYLKLCQAGVTDTQRRLEDAFLEGKVGFVISGDWLLKRIETEKPSLPFATFLIPGPNGIDGSASFAGGEYLAVNAASTHPDLALALVRHISSPANQLRFCLQNRSANPSSTVAAGDSVFLSQPHFDTFVRQMAAAKMPPVHPQWVYIEDRLEKAVEAALYGVKTPSQALADAAREIQELLDK